MNLNKRESLILYLLNKTDTITAKEISDSLNVSVRTVKNDISLLRSKLEVFNILINSTPGLGYSLELSKSKVSPKDIITTINESVDSIKSFSTNYDRVIYIIKKLIDYYDGVNFEDLADEMYISLSTLRNDLKSVKEISEDFEVKLVMTKDKIIKFKGLELDIRNLIFEYYSNLKSNIIGLDEEYLSNKLIESIKDGIVLSDYTIHNIASFTLIALLREMDGFNLIYPNTNFNDKKVFELTKRYIDFIIEDFNIPINSHTMFYIFNQIKNKQVYYDDRLINETDGIEEVIKDIIIESKTNFDIDFENEKEFIYALKLHIAALIQRVKNKMSTNIQIDYEHLRKYLFGCKMTMSAVEIIEKYYSLEIPMDEFVLLVYYFNGEILKQQRNKTKIIGFVSSRGRAENLMFINQLENNFYLPKYKVTTFENAHELKKQINNVDLVVTSNNALFQELNNNNIVDIRNPHFVDEIRNLFHLQTIKNIELNKYFKLEYLKFGIKGYNRQEVMGSLISYLKEINVFHKERSKNIQFKDIELGNGILMLQDINRVCKNPIFFVGYLENPIIWHKEVITTITLIKTKKDGDKDLPTLCNLLSTWISDKNKIKGVYLKKDYSFYIKSLLRQVGDINS